MNAAIRAIVRTGVHQGLEMFGVSRGFEGLISGQFTPLGGRDVSGIIQQGGTFLGSARCPDFATEQGQRAGLRQLTEHGIEALFVIGGSGSQQGTHALARAGFPVIGVASTIDNDLCGSDITIGVDTALNIALEAIDRLKVTASSHHRGLLVEVMGRNCGYLALMAGVAGGAEAIVIPEREIEPEALADLIRSSYENGKKHALIVVAEGARNNAERLNDHFRANKTRLGFELRVTILGHVQRGGVPTAFDRLLATRLGIAAVESLVQGKTGVLIGSIGNRAASTPLSEVVTGTKPLDFSLLQASGILM
jgi:6-phosphofructokinase 1